MRTCNKRSLCWSLFFNKVSGLTPETLLKILWYVDKYALACPFLSMFQLFECRDTHFQGAALH